MIAGALAEYAITEEQRNQFKTMLRNYCEKNGAADKADEVEVRLLRFIVPPIIYL